MVVLLLYESVRIGWCFILGFYYLGYNCCFCFRFWDIVLCFLGGFFLGGFVLWGFFGFFYCLVWFDLFCCYFVILFLLLLVGVCLGFVVCGVWWGFMLGLLFNFGCLVCVFYFLFCIYICCDIFCGLRMCGDFAYFLSFGILFGWYFYLW